MKAYRLLLFSLAGLMFSCVRQPEYSMAPACREGLSERLRGHVEYLADDACQGRMPFSKGADRAVTYLESQMREIGLQPCFGDSYLQQVPLVMIRTRVSDTMELNTPAGRRDLLFGMDFTAFTASRRPTVEVRNAELVFAGYGIVAPEYGKDDFAGIENPGSKVAVVLVNDPGLGTDGEYFNGDEMTYYGRWTYKLEEAARRGFGGVLIIHDDRGAGYPWSVVTASAGLKYGLDVDDPTNEVCPLQGWLSNDAARTLMADCGRDFDELAAAAGNPDFKPVALNASLSVAMESTFSYDRSPNVAGYLPGSDAGGECIICTAHWDHLGFSASPVAGDSIINGATDNATAMAWLLETARAFAAADRQPRRSIVFLCPTCEEKGMWGSEFYASHPLFPAEKTAAVVNLDVIPLWGENDDVTITGYGHSELDALMEKVAVRHGRYVMADPEGYNGMFYRSDHLPFMRRGVPAMFAKGWSDNRCNGPEWSLAMKKDYWANIYHKPCDQTGGADDYSGLVQEVELFYDFISTLAYSDTFPQWKPGAEFSR